MMVIACGMFMNQLDSTILATSIPQIADSIGENQGDFSESHRDFGLDDSRRGFVFTGVELQVVAHRRIVLDGVRKNGLPCPPWGLAACCEQGPQSESLRRTSNPSAVHLCRLHQFC